MLVDLVELREQGVKRPREVVLAATPLRGELSLSEGRPGWHVGQRNPPLLAGLVVPGRAEWALPPLDRAYVKVIRNGNMVIHGIQQFSSSGRDRDLRSFPQAWWCRIVGAPVRERPASARRAADAGEHVVFS